MKYAVDFDGTLITFHYYDSHTLQDLFDGRRRSLCTFLEKALDDGHEVGIVTFNDRVEGIVDFLEMLWPNHFIKVFGRLPESFDDGKTKHIQKLYPDTDPSEICLIDDSFHNIKIANDLGFKTWYIKD